MKTAWLVVFGVALQSLVAIGQEDITSSLMPTDDGHGVAACVTVGFDDFRELPMKAVEGAWSLIVCVTQPVHPFHYLRDANSKVITDGKGRKRKVWLPFYRLWGKYQADSAVGIVHDSRSTNGLGGSQWFAGYGNGGWKDKSGKLVGVALLAWGATEALDHDRGTPRNLDVLDETLTVVSTEASDEEMTEDDSGDGPGPEPEPLPLTLPEEWDGEGGPVGR